jgi:hypothetical protein
MRIAKPLLLVTTPLGVAGALHEAFRLAGGLGFLMLLMVSMITIAMCGVVLTIRNEQRAAAQAEAAKLAVEGVET